MSAFLSECPAQASHPAMPVSPPPSTGTSTVWTALAPQTLTMFGMQHRHALLLVLCNRLARGDLTFKAGSLLAASTTSAAEAMLQSACAGGP